VQFGFPINELAVLAQECAQKEAHVLNEILLVIAAIPVCFFDVSFQWQHLQYT